MFLVESKPGAVACMLLSLLLLGTWPAILTLLERRGRLPQHTYLDYSITNFLAAVVIALTFGQVGDSKPNMPNFITQLSQDTWPCVLMAMLGGLFLSLGNVSIQYAWAFVGLSVAQVITSSIAVVIGTSLNYFLDDKINKASILFPGVGCFLTAVLLGAIVHSSNAADNAAKLRSFHENMKDTSNVPEESDKTRGKSEKDILEDIEIGDLSIEETKKAGTAESIIAITESRSFTVTYKCGRKPKACNWCLRASKKDNVTDAFTIVTYKGPHHPSCVGRTVPLDHPHMKRAFISRVIKPLVEADWGFKVNHLRKTITMKYGFTISYMKAWHAKQRAIADIFGDWEESYALLPRYLATLKEANPGTMVHFQNVPCHYSVDVEQFDRVFWAFGPSIRGFEFCRPLISIDGTHLYGKYRGFFLWLSVLTRMIKSTLWHLRLLKKKIPIHEHGSWHAKETS